MAMNVTAQLLGRVAPLFAPVHPTREPEDAEPEGPDRNRHQQNVIFLESRRLPIHSRNLRSASLPSTCKNAQKAKQVTANSNRGIPDSVGCDRPYIDAASALCRGEMMAPLPAKLRHIFVDGALGGAGDRRDLAHRHGAVLIERAHLRGEALLPSPLWGGVGR